MSNNKQSANLVAALEYIKRGWKIFPLFYVLKNSTCSCKWEKCKRIGKHPLTPNGLFNASSDEAQVKQWWTESPYANIGLATGHNGLIVVDVDMGMEKKTGLPKIGPESWQALQERHELVPNTLRVKTGGGGTHLYFLSVKEIKNSRDKLGKHIDVRGHGGYVILPPSNHESGGKYAWDGNDEGAKIADLPDWLEKLLMGESVGCVDVSQDFDPIQDQKIARGTRAGIEPATPEQIIKLLYMFGSDGKRYLSPDCDRDTWWQIGAALKNELGDKRGWDAWSDWSKGCPAQWDEKTALIQWDNFTPDRKGTNGKSIGVGTIFHFAKENGFRGFDKEAADSYEIRDKWVYAVSIKQFVDTERLMEVDREQFDAMFAPQFSKGTPSKHVLQNEAFRRLDGVTYWPRQPEIVKESNRECLNYWRPSKVTPLPGEVKMFLKHVEYLFPGERPEGAKPDDVHISQDGNILLDYLAFQVRYPGEKVHWAVMLVGDQGNGKSYFITVMRLVLGEHNVGKVNNERLHEPFTAWQRNTQFITVEETMAKGRLELMDKLKPMITEDWCTIREMYRPAYVQPNRFNFLLLTNHDNALLLDKTDRRYCILKTDAPAHPLSNAYYGPLFDWTRNNASVIAYYLLNRPLDHFQPKAHAPMTVGKKAMIRQSMTPLKEFIDERVEAKEYPFHWDVVSTSVLLKPLEKYNLRTNTKELGKAFKELGYLDLGQNRTVKNERIYMWAVRDIDTYRGMDASQLRQVWLAQINGRPNDPNFTIDPMAGDEPKNPLMNQEAM